MRLSSGGGVLAVPPGAFALWPSGSPRMALLARGATAADSVCASGRIPG